MSINKTKILVVDDNQHLLDIINDHLLANGYDVSCSLNGVDAKQKIIDIKPSIVITDIVMPEVDGIELLLKIKEINPNIRIIVMSGGNRGYADTYLQMADKLGADAILNKPFLLEDLLAEVQKLEASL